MFTVVENQDQVSLKLKISFQYKNWTLTLFHIQDGQKI